MSTDVTDREEHKRERRKYKKERDTFIKQVTLKKMETNIEEFFVL